MGTLWILALPYEGLWKGTYVDEHALQPAQVGYVVRTLLNAFQVNTYYDWSNVHEADRYLDDLELLVNATQSE